MATSRVANLRRMLSQVAPGGQPPTELQGNPEAQADGLPAPLASPRVAGRPQFGPSLAPQREKAAALETEMALESLEVLQRGEDVDDEQRFVLEAIVLPYHRPVVDVVGDYLKTSQLTSTWAKLGTEALRPWITQRVRSVGRINVPSLPSLPYAGTGFIVGDGLLMTNRHVASIFALGLGNRQLQFQAGQRAAIDFYHENGQATSDSLTVEKVVMIHPWWDMALLKVSGLPANREPLELSVEDPATMLDREVVVIGYPGYDPNPDEEFQRVQNRIFRSTYYVKRLQPGLFKAREQAESYERMVEAVTHDCSTLGGNSGSAVIDVQTGHVVGLHFAGAYLVANYAVSPYDLAQDSRVVDAGVKFVGKLDPRGDFYGPIWRATDSATEANTTALGPHPQAPAPLQPGNSLSPTINIRLGTSAVNLTIPLNISISLGTPVGGTATLLTGAPTILPVITPVTGEGLFSQPPPPVFAELSRRFSATSLSKTQFGWPTALSMALASRLSYDNAGGVLGLVRNPWRMQTCEFVEADDTQCFLASTATEILISFRGTESLGDWLSNLTVISSTRPYGTVHRGFLGAFQVVEAKLKSLLANLQGRAIVLTGHSLGGALATIAAAEWRAAFNIRSVYTFGQPAVGRANFRSFIDQHFAGKFFRFVNDDDIVPRVPPTYSHVGRLYHFNAAGKLHTRVESLLATGSPGTLESPAGPPMLNELEFDRLRAQLLQQRAQSRAIGRESISAPALEGLLPSVSDHSMELYLAKIAKAGDRS